MAARARERLFRRAALGSLLAIYLTAWPLQFALDFLRARNLLRWSMAVVFALAGAAVAAWLGRRRAGWREWAMLAGLVAAYLFLALRLRIVQERLHLVEYGLVALLFEAALAARFRAAAQPPRSARLRAAAGAFLLTFAGGFVDEVIQGILPNRQYDLRDVTMNGFAGALALVAAASLAAARGRDAARSEPA